MLVEVGCLACLLVLAVVVVSSEAVAVLVGGLVEKDFSCLSAVLESLIDGCCSSME